MTRLTESAIEEFAIQLLEKQGFEYLNAPDDEAERSDYSQVLLTGRLQAALRRINPESRCRTSRRWTRATRWAFSRR